MSGTKLYAGFGFAAVLTIAAKLDNYGAYDDYSYYGVSPQEPNQNYDYHALGADEYIYVLYYIMLHHTICILIYWAHGPPGAGEHLLHGSVTSRSDAVYFLFEKLMCLFFLYFRSK